MGRWLYHLVSHTMHVHAPSSKFFSVFWHLLEWKNNIFQNCSNLPKNHFRITNLLFFSRFWRQKPIVGEGVVLTTCVPNMRFGKTGGVEVITNMTKMIPQQHWLSAEYKPESRTQKYSECQTPQCGKNTLRLNEYLGDFIHFETQIFGVEMTLPLHWPLPPIKCGKFHFF